MERVIVYVDGFNLYYGLKSRKWRRYYWLDLRRLAERLLRPGQQLETVHYFTTRVVGEPNDPGKPTRQNSYLEALGTLKNLEIHYGYFLQKEQTCYRCGAMFRTHEEKMTDVNIAVQLLTDAHADRFDAAMIVSADSDLTGPVVNVRNEYPEKRVVAVFPPDRVSKRLRQVASTSFTIGRAPIRDSQLPERVINSVGHVVERPAGWR